MSGRGFSSALFSFSRRKIFSTSTMASSTSSPIATANPPSVITLMESSVPEMYPINRKTSVVITSDSGIAVSVMNVVLKFSRNRNNIMITSTAPITSASPTLKIPRSMKLRSWNNSGLMAMSAVSDSSASANAVSKRSVRPRVST